MMEKKLVKEREAMCWQENVRGSRENGGQGRRVAATRGNGECRRKTRIRVRRVGMLLRGEEAFARGDKHDAGASK